MRRTVPVVLAAVLILLIAFLLLVLVPPWPVSDAQPEDRPAEVPALRIDPPPGTTVPPDLPAPVPGRAPDPVPAPAFRIHGRVVDDRGAGVGGADLEIRAWSGEEPKVLWTTYRSRTTAEGSFSVAADRERTTGGFGIETAAEGYLEGWLLVKPGDYDEARGVEIAVEPARSIVGRVIDEYARPIAGTTVQLWYGSETTWPTKVDADGRFRTPARAPRRAFELVVEAPRYPRRKVPVPACPGDASTDVGDVVFRRGGRLEGIAVDGGGRALGDIPIIIAGVAGEFPSTRTDAGGRFAFKDLGEGTVWVCTDGPVKRPDASGAQRTWRGRLDDVEVGRTDLKLVLVPETIVILRFVDATNGEPVRVKESQSWIWTSGTAMPKSPNTGGSDSNGYSTVWITVLSGARYDALVRTPGFEDARVEGIDVPDIAKTTVDVPMRRSR